MNGEKEIIEDNKWCYFDKDDMSRGPFSKEELLKKITKDTLIFKEGESPRPAYEYEELNFENCEIKTKDESEKKSSVKQKKEKNYGWVGILLIGLCYILLKESTPKGSSSSIFFGVFLILLCIGLFVFLYYWVYVITKAMKQLKNNSLAIEDRNKKIGFTTMSVLNLICFCPYSIYLFNYLFDWEIEYSFEWVDIIYILYISLLIITLVLSILKDKKYINNDDISNSWHWKNILYKLCISCTIIGTCLNISLIIIAFYYLF